jgi:xanthine dehydrogenase YagR molybdenum-binding subunit
MDNKILPGDLSVGRPLDRIDGVQKVTGEARYAAEFDLPNLAHAVSVQSTIANGRIKAIDSREAEQLPGVLAVITHLNAPKLNSFPENTQKSKPEDTQQQTPGKPGQKLLPLQGDRIYYNGQHVAVVVATTFEQALYAASRVRVSYQQERPVTEMERHLDEAFHAPDQPGREPNNSLRGDPDGGLLAAPVRVDQIYRTPVENHNPMEPSATIAAWNGDKLAVYDATQWVSGSQNVVARLLGIPSENVRTICYFLGGGFGCKGFTWPHTVLAAIAAQKVGRPVKLELTRQQMFTSVGYRAQTRQRVALGASREGHLISVIHDTINLTSPYDEFVEKCGVIAPMLYASPNARAQHKLVRVNRGTPTSMRGPGESPGSFALESAMDELAYALKLDPIKLRLRNYTDTDPSHHNRPWSSKALRECYALGAEKFGWQGRNPQPRATRDGDLLVGMGMATATYPTNRSQAAVRVEILADGHARAVSGTQDLGTGTYTIMTQIAADTLGLSVRNVHFELGDSGMPQAPVSGGSQTAASVGSAVKAAATEARRQAIQMTIADMASPLYGQSEDQIVVTDGRLSLKTDPKRGETYADLLKRHNMPSLTANGSSKPGPEKQEYSMHAHGAQFAEVRVNPHTGETRVVRMVGAFAAGRILNAKTGHSQLIGGMVWGIGMALLEQTVTDPRLGRIMNANLAEYLVPVNRDVPNVEAYFVDEVDLQVNPIGVKGIGELGVVGAAGAIANAVYHATGRRIRELPITPDKLI